MTKFISIVLYWLVIFPIGVFQKIFGIKGFDAKPGKSVKSYWQPRRHNEKAAERYRRQF